MDKYLDIANSNSLLAQPINNQIILPMTFTKPQKTENGYLWSHWNAIIKKIPRRDDNHERKLSVTINGYNFFLCYEVISCVIKMCVGNILEIYD